jgi:hypothetical protein
MEKILPLKQIQNGNKIVLETVSRDNDHSVINNEKDDIFP